MIEADSARDADQKGEELADKLCDEGEYSDVVLINVEKQEDL